MITGACVAVTPLTETLLATIDDGTVVPLGKTTMMLSPTASAPSELVVAETVYVAALDVVFGEGVAVTLVNTVAAAAVMVYFTDVTGDAVSLTRSVRV